MALSTLKFYGRPKEDVNIRVPPNDSDDSALASDSDEERLITRNTTQISVIPEIDDDENHVVSPTRSQGRKGQTKKKRRKGRKSTNKKPDDDTGESSEEDRPNRLEEVNWNKEVVDILEAPQWTQTLQTSDLLFSPIDYFKMFVGNELIVF